jgi:hypothetical protein
VRGGPQLRPLFETELEGGSFLEREEASFSERELEEGSFSEEGIEERCSVQRVIEEERPLSEREPKRPF